MSLEAPRPAEDEVVFEDYDYPGDFLRQPVWLADEVVEIPRATQIDYDNDVATDISTSPIVY